jgi:hypothetical protein
MKGCILLFFLALSGCSTPGSQGVIEDLPTSTPIAASIPATTNFATSIPLPTSTSTPIPYVEPIRSPTPTPTSTPTPLPTPTSTPIPVPSELGYLVANIISAVSLADVPRLESLGVVDCRDWFRRVDLRSSPTENLCGQPQGAFDVVKRLKPNSFRLAGRLEAVNGLCASNLEVGDCTLTVSLHLSCVSPQISKDSKLQFLLGSTSFDYVPKDAPPSLRNLKATLRGISIDGQALQEMFELCASL